MGHHVVDVTRQPAVTCALFFASAVVVKNWKWTSVLVLPEFWAGIRPLVSVIAAESRFGGHYSSAAEHHELVVCEFFDNEKESC